jgi:peptidoglycan-associated lipoprotein
MKPIKFTNLLVIALIFTVAATGCRKKPVGVTPLPGSPVGRPETPPRGPAIPSTDRIPREGTPSSTTQGSPLTGYPSNEATSHQGWIENSEALKAQTVYFDFDSSVVKGPEKSKVAAVAAYLKANPTAAVRVEGNCDERGTEEYNRALGERRALAVREELIGQGIAPKDVDTISYGKDRPADPGHDEAAWSKNRRDDFIVLTPPGK